MRCEEAAFLREPELINQELYLSNFTVATKPQTLAPLEKRSQESIIGKPIETYELRQQPSVEPVTDTSKPNSYRS